MSRPTSPKTTTKYVLMTNLDYVDLHLEHGGKPLFVRTSSHMLFLEDRRGEEDPLRPPTRVYGFGHARVARTFEIAVPSIAYELTPAASQNFVIQTDEGFTPLYSGYVLQLAGGPRLDLIVADDKRPIDVVTFESDDSEDSIQDQRRFWNGVEDAVYKYWCGPNAPITIYRPLAEARSLAAEIRRAIR